MHSYMLYMCLRYDVSLTRKKVKQCLYVKY